MMPGNERNYYDDRRRSKSPGGVEESRGSIERTIVLGIKMRMLIHGKARLKHGKRFTFAVAHKHGRTIIRIHLIVTLSTFGGDVLTTELCGQQGLSPQKRCLKDAPANTSTLELPEIQPTSQIG